MVNNAQLGLAQRAISAIPFLYLLFIPAHATSVGWGCSKLNNWGSRAPCRAVELPAVAQGSQQAKGQRILHTSAKALPQAVRKVSFVAHSPCCLHASQVDAQIRTDTSGKYSNCKVFGYVEGSLCHRALCRTSATHEEAWFTEGSSELRSASNVLQLFGREFRAANSCRTGVTLSPPKAAQQRCKLARKVWLLLGCQLRLGQAAELRLYTGPASNRPDPGQRPQA